VWTEKASKLIGFELDHDIKGVLMMDVEHQKKASDDIGDKQDMQMRQAECNKNNKWTRQLIVIFLNNAKFYV